MTGEPGVKAPRAGEPAAPKEISGQLRSVVSLLIFFHLFCIVTVLFGNQYASSALQIRLKNFLGPYTRNLFFDPQVLVGYHLTHAMEFEDDHLVEIRSADGSVIGRYPDPEGGKTGLRGGFRYRRWLALTRRFAWKTETGDDEYLAELGRSIGQHQLGEGDRQKIELRIVRRLPLDLTGESEADAGGPDAYVPAYSADVWRDTQGNIRILKRVETGEAAPVDAES